MTIPENYTGQLAVKYVKSLQILDYTKDRKSDPLFVGSNLRNVRKKHSDETTSRYM